LLPSRSYPSQLLTVIAFAVWIFFVSSVHRL
jgi:hypothetical protein